MEKASLREPRVMRLNLILLVASTVLVKSASII